VTTLRRANTDNCDELLRAVLLKQFEIAWNLLEIHLADLRDEECFCQPTGHGPTLHLLDGEWIADWPEDEDYGIGAASIAWLT